MKTLFISPRVLSAALAIACSTSVVQAQSVITVYENDFESPATTECDRGISNLYGTFASDYGSPTHPITQIQSADRVCITAVDDGSSIVDPAGTGDTYSGGMVAVPSQNWVEAWSLQFDPQSYRFLNLSLDWSLVNIPIQPNYMPSTPRNTVARFYRVPAGAAFALVDNGASPASATLDGTPATAFSQSSFTINPLPAADYPAKQFTLNWQQQNLSIDLNGQGFQPGDKVAIVYHLEGDYTYAAFDNLRVTASTTAGGQTAAPVPVPVNGLPLLAFSALGLVALARRRMARKAD